MFGHSKKTGGSFVATQTGKVVDVTTLHDPVFAEKMLGDGFAILPEENEVHAPVSGVILDVQAAKHAYGIETKDGLEVLVHIGIDTVSMNGEGFTSFVKTGDKIKEGDLLATADLQKIKDKGLETYTVTLITNMDQISELTVDYDEHAEAGKTVVMQYQCKK